MKDIESINIRTMLDELLLGEELDDPTKTLMHGNTILKYIFTFTPTINVNIRLCCGPRGIYKPDVTPFTVVDFNVNSAFSLEGGNSVNVYQLLYDVFVGKKLLTYEEAGTLHILNSDPINSVFFGLHYSYGESIETIELTSQTGLRYELPLNSIITLEDFAPYESNI